MGKRFNSSRWMFVAFLALLLAFECPVLAELNPSSIEVAKNEMIESLKHYQSSYLDIDFPQRAQEQSKIDQLIRLYLYNGGEQGYIHSPTRSGKFVIMSKILQGLLGRNNHQGLIVVDTLEALLNSKQMLIRHGGFNKNEVGFYFGQEKTLNQKIIITTYQSLALAKDKNIFESKKFPLVLFSEAHHMTAYGASIAANLLKESIRLGETATPWYADQKQVKNLLPDEIYKLSTPDAVAKKNLLSSYKNILVHFSNIDLSSSNSEFSESGYDQEKLSQIFDALEKHRVTDPIIKIYNEISPLTKYKKALVFCNGIKHAKSVSVELNKSGIPSEHVSGTMSMNERRNVFDQFKIGQIKVITSDQLLIESFDDPEIEIIINADPSLSAINVEQRGGRGMSLLKSFLDKVNYVIDFVYENSERNISGRPWQLLFGDVVGAPESYSSQDLAENAKSLPFKLKSFVDNNVKMIIKVEEINALYNKVSSFGKEINRQRDVVIIHERANELMDLLLKKNSKLNWVDKLGGLERARRIVTNFCEKNNKQINRIVDLIDDIENNSVEALRNLNHSWSVNSQTYKEYDLMRIIPFWNKVEKKNNPENPRIIFDEKSYDLIFTDKQVQKDLKILGFDYCFFPRSLAYRYLISSDKPNFWSTLTGQTDIYLNSKSMSGKKIDKIFYENSKFNYSNDLNLKNIFLDSDVRIVLRFLDKKLFLALSADERDLIEECFLKNIKYSEFMVSRKLNESNFIKLKASSFEKIKREVIAGNVKFSRLISEGDALSLEALKEAFQAFSSIANIDIKNISNYKTSENLLVKLGFPSTKEIEKILKENKTTFPKLLGYYEYKKRVKKNKPVKGVASERLDLSNNRFDSEGNFESLDKSLSKGVSQENNVAGFLKKILNSFKIKKRKSIDQNKLYSGPGLIVDVIESFGNRVFEMAQKFYSSQYSPFDSAGSFLQLPKEAFQARVVVSEKLTNPILKWLSRWVLVWNLFYYHPTNAHENIKNMIYDLPSLEVHLRKNENLDVESHLEKIEKALESHPTAFSEISGVRKIGEHFVPINFELNKELMKKHRTKEQVRTSTQLKPHSKWIDRKSFERSKTRSRGK